MADLPPLNKDSLDGERFEAPIGRDTPLPKRCTHKGKVTLKSTIELTCVCGTGWTGPDIQKLYTLLK